MFGLLGLPDFGAPIVGGPAAIYFRYHLVDAAAVMPDRLVVSTLENGQPDFQLSLVRSANAMDPAPAAAALRMRLGQHSPLEESLKVVRALQPRLTLAAAQPETGFIRLRSLDSRLSLSEELTRPQLLNWAGLDAVQLVVSDLSVSTAALISKLLLDRTLLILARLEVLMPGVSPRLPSSVSFAPRVLLNAALAATPAPRQLEWTTLVAAVLRHASLLTLSGGGPLDGEQHVRLAETVADRLCATFGRFVPSLNGDQALFEFASESELPDRVQWDLSEPVKAHRPWLVELDPLQAPRDLAAQTGLASLISYYSLPSLQLGVWEVFVSANLPTPREGIAAIGIQLCAKARPPGRMQDVVAHLEFRAPQDEGRVRLQLSPKEPLVYQWSTYVVLLVGNELCRLDTAERPHGGLALSLGPDDFPVLFVPISATKEVLDAASIQGLLKYEDAAGARREVPFVLSTERHATSLALPRDAKNAAIYVTAAAKDGAAAVQLGPFPASPLLLGLEQFPDFGPQRVCVTAVASPGGPDTAVELVPEGQEGNPDAVALLYFTAEITERVWTYVATTPFHSGYRYRRFSPSEPKAPWSEVLMPTTPLVVPSEQKAGPESAFELNGVHLYVDAADPKFLRYLPAVPIPARGPDGRPLMALYQLGEAGAILQLSVRFDLEEAERDQLRVALADKHLDLCAATFQPAPITVDRVAVTLAATSAAEPPTLLASSSGSGFPPWDAIFSIRLTKEQAERAGKAMAGESGIVAIAVHAKLQPSVSSTLAGSPADIERSVDVARWVSHP